MTRKTTTQYLIIVSMTIMAFSPGRVAAELAGQWYGTFTPPFPVGWWASPEFPTGSTLEMRLIPNGAGQYWAVLYLPELGLVDTPLAMTVSGDQLAIGAPPFAFGVIDGDTVSGLAFIPDASNPGIHIPIEWQMQRETTAGPGPFTGPNYGAMPPLLCPGDAEFCSELVQFSPAIGTGYIDYLVKDETWDDQYRSYIRRDMMQAVQYAAAKLEARTSDWDYGNIAPIGLGDMSNANGLAPSTNGVPDHLTHEDGNHIDIAYFQRYATDNLLRPVGRHHQGLTDVVHLTQPPHALDTWRTALFMAYLSEHPHLRFILTDGQTGSLLEEAFLTLEATGWLAPGTLEKVPLLYSVDDESKTYFLGHHNHMHITMDVLEPIVHSVALQPSTLNVKSRGAYITAYIELIDGYDPAAIDIASVGLIVNGHVLVPAETFPTRVGDYDRNGIADLMVKFNRQAIVGVIGRGMVDMAFIGNIDGVAFQETSTINVIGR